jgi:AcrR family transcriptional regulator
MANPVDRRVQKTRRLLQKAFIDLIVEKGYDCITVQDILDKANVGRSTFYTHFQDKDELLHDCFAEFHNLMEQHIVVLSQGSEKTFNLEKSFDFLLNFLIFAEQNRQLLKALLSQQELSESIKNSLLANLNDPFKKRLAREKNTEIPPEIVTQYFVNAFFGTLKWWITNDILYTAQEIDRYIKQLAMPTIKTILKTY